jgi:hypothetical protein
MGWVVTLRMERAEAAPMGRAGADPSHGDSETRASGRPWKAGAFSAGGRSTVGEVVPSRLSVPASHGQHWVLLLQLAPAAVKRNAS